jgi:hypothetical protein
MDYRITCTIKSQPVSPHFHGHVIRVGVGDDQVWRQMLTVDQVYTMMRNQDRFYVVGMQSRKTAFVNPYRCDQCGINSLRSAPDAVQDNNIDNLPACQGG